MNLIHQNGHHFLLHTSKDELVGISNALNEVCNGIDIADGEFHARLGLTCDETRDILAAVGSYLDAAPGDFDTVTAWADGCSVQVRCVSAYGDPVDMSSEEARELARLLLSCADKADSA